MACILLLFRTNETRKKLFMELEDGAELFYMTNGKKVLSGIKMDTGIRCSCCKEVVSASKFEAHAGFSSRKQPYRSIYTASGISLQEVTNSLQRQVAFKDIELNLERIIKLPKDIACILCNDRDFETGNELSPSSSIFCAQCKKLYHVGCLKGHEICDLQKRPIPSFSWLCSSDCEEFRERLECLVKSSPHDIHSATTSRSLKKLFEEGGLSSQNEHEVKWQLLSGSNKTVDNEALFSKATKILTEAFGPIVEDGNDLIPAMVNGGELAKQHFGGMHCAVITRKSEVVSACLLRVFGRDLAELPLVATDKECYRRGYFRTLLHVVEELLMTFKVKSLVLPVDEEAKVLWNNYGFARVSKDRGKLYAERHGIVRFKKKILLEKSFLQFQSKNDMQLSISLSKAISAAAKSIKPSIPTSATTPSAQINITEQTSPKLKKQKRNDRDHALFLSQARKDKALIDPLTSPGHDIVRINDAPVYRASSSEVLVEVPLGLLDGLFFQNSMTVASETLVARTSAPESCFPSMLPSTEDVLEQDRLATSSAISRSARIRKIITDLQEELRDEKRKHEEHVKRLEDEKEDTKIGAADAKERARRLGQEVDASTKRIADLEQLVIEEREKSALLRIEKELVALRDHGQEVDAFKKRIADLEQLVIEEREKSALLGIEKEELVALRDQLIKAKEEAAKAT